MKERHLAADSPEVRTPTLPHPWRHIGTLEDATFEALELAAGSEIKLDDLSQEEREGTLRTPRAAQALGHNWVEIRNEDNEARVYIRLQSRERPEDPSVRVSAVVVPFQPGKDLTGADLRSIPVQALTAAYSEHEDEGMANLLRGLHLMGAQDEDPLAPLPSASADDGFSARVARQYVKIEQTKPGINPVEEMVAINGAAKSSVQRWITRARRRGFLPPATQARRHA